MMVVESFSKETKASPACLNKGTDTLPLERHRPLGIANDGRLRS
ncbi:hypothetical protein [Komarekiella delphini-convector]|nr:hypothetical protein [Komarekiella delphini-convector]